MVLDAVVPGERARAADLARVALTVDDRQGMHRRRFSGREREARGRVHAPRKQDHTSAKRPPGARQKDPPTAARMPTPINTLATMASRFVDPLVR